MLTAARLIALACQVAKCPNYATQGLDLLNVILADLCETYDFALARGLFAFTFNPGLATAYGSGPYNLPVDYLRSSGSSGSSGTQKSSFWTLQGVPHPMVPCDLSEFDMQVQQAGQQSFPWLWATDMSVGSVVLSTTGTLAGTTAVSALGSVAGVVAGMGVAGDGIVPGTLVASVGASSAVLNQAATKSAAGVPLMFGACPAGYAFPPPSGAYPVTIRYQRQMPDITDTAKVPWFPNQKFLLKMLAGKLMEITDDGRAGRFTGLGTPDDPGAQAILDKYLMMKDDDTNRAQTVQLDRRRFGESFSKLPNTKSVGW